VNNFKNREINFAKEAQKCSFVLNMNLDRNPYNKIISPFTALIIFATILACSLSNESPSEFNYIHVAHTRIFDTVNQVIDPRMEKIDYGQFDMVLLGGDLCEESSKDFSTLEYLDSIFDLKSPATLWALGNHDNANLELVEKATYRPRFYTTHYNGITFIVLYTQEKEDWICTITGRQLELIKNVADTIQNSSHLVVMTHKLIWIKDHPDMKEHQGVKYYDWSCNYAITQNGWQTEIAPLLHKVEAKGIEVIALAGDIGNNVSEFEVHADDGIDYLASGTNPEKKGIKFLHFKHDPATSDLKWRFIPVEQFTSGDQSLNWPEEPE